MFNYPLINSLRRRGTQFLRLVAAFGLLSMACAQAQTYVPHSELTPYQFVAWDGRCMQAYDNNVHVTYYARLAICDANDNLQKFYLLQAARDEDVLPQQVSESDEVRARIVLAQNFDDVTGAKGEYRHLSTDFQGFRSVSFTRGLDHLSLGSARILWQLSRIPVSATELTAVAAQNEVFRVTGERIVHFGVAGQMVSKLVRGIEHPDGMACNAQTFGRDPVFFMPKSCFVETPPEVANKFQMKFIAVASLDGIHGHQCLARDPHNPNTIKTSHCFKASKYEDPAKAVFTLRPTSYPR